VVPRGPRTLHADPAGERLRRRVVAAGEPAGRGGRSPGSVTLTPPSRSGASRGCAPPRCA
jgi:hypothetical protein